MDAAWQAWTDDNIARGCAHVEIRDILRSHHFTLEQIRDAMGDAFPSDGLADHNALTRIAITRTATALASDLVQLYTYDHFLTDAECDALIALSMQQLRPSTITTQDPDTYFRTSSTCDLSLMHDPAIEAIDRIISEKMGIRLPYSEGIQAQRYEIAQQFKAHTDFFEPNTEEYTKFAGTQGNRTWTCMIYLNDTEQGGGTYFPRLNRTFYPKKGQALIWNNLHPDGTPNRDTIHAGQPVEKGEKVIITKWFRENGSGPMFTDAPA